MLTDANSNQIKDYIIQELPRIFEQEPEFVLELDKILREEFEGQEEFAELLKAFADACEIYLAREQI